MRIFIAVIGLTAAMYGADPAQTLQKGIDLMESKGDVAGAIKHFETAARSTERAVAARALLYLARAQERSGTERARQTYERIARDFSDQRDIAVQARERLGALSVGPAGTSRGLTARQLFAGPDVDSEGMPTPDGRKMAMVHWDSGDLAVKDISTGELKRLLLKQSWTESNEYGEWPVLSPDERQIVYAWFSPAGNGYQLRLAPVQPGAKPRVLIQNPEYTYFIPVGWSPDGKAVLATVWNRGRTSQIAWISASDGSIKTVRSMEWREPAISLSPDGRYIAYDAQQSTGSSVREIHVVSADGQSDNVVVKGASIDANPIWTPDGARLVFTSNRSGTFALWSIGIRNGKAEGTAQLLKSDIGTVFLKTFTRSGSLLYFQESSTESITLATIDPATGKASAAPMRISDSSVGNNRAASWSTDGKSLAYLSRRAGVRRGTGASSLVVRSMVSETERVYPIALSLPALGSPIWSQDDKSILLPAFESLGNRTYYRLDLATGQARVALPIQYLNLRPIATLSPDNRAMFAVLDAQDRHKVSVRAIELGTGKEQIIYELPGDGFIPCIALSPDGSTLALIASHQKEAKQDRELLLMDKDGKNVRRVPGALGLQAGTGSLAWSPDGKYLYTLRKQNGDGGLVEIHRMSPDGVTQSTPTGITAKHIRYLSLDPTGTRFTFTTGQQGAVSEFWSLDNVLPTRKGAL